MAPSLFIPWFELDVIHIPGLPETIAIRPFGLLVGIGLFVGYRLAERRATRLGLKEELIFDFIAHVVLIGFFLSHLFDRLLYEPRFLIEQPWDLLMPWRSMSSFGGFFGGVIGAFIWKWHRGLDITVPLDQVAFAMPVAWLFGRLGCFVVHDHPGKLTSFCLAVDDYQFGDLPVGPRHDLGLYEVFWTLPVIVLFWALDRKPRPHGFYIGLIAVLYAPFRFMLDFLREVDVRYSGLTPGHYSALLAFGVGVFLLARAVRSPITEMPAAMLRKPPKSSANRAR